MTGEMSDFSNKPEDATAEIPASSDDETASLQKIEVSAKTSPSFWARAARIWRSAGSGNLRADLADALAADGGAGIAFSPEERAMLNNILRFREIRVEDVMVPRADIEAVDLDMPLGELMVLFEESGRSRMPVYSDTLDDPRGMVHIRDLLAYVTKQARNKRRPRAKASKSAAATEIAVEKPPRVPKPAFDLGRVNLDTTILEAGILRPVLFVPPSMLASELLAKMQANRTQMALVIDEYGGTDGLASLEDIVEMVVGDIEDEHDDDEAMFTRQSDDVFVADAKIELEEIAAAIGPDFDIAHRLDDVDTLGGLIFAVLGRIPARGEVVQALPGFEFHVMDADPRRIKKVRITRKRAALRRRTKNDGERGSGPELPDEQE